MQNINQNNGASVNPSPSVDYEYDDNGNMRKDANKGIESISYNHLNLPITIIFDETHKIEYLYDGTGIKVQKKVTNDALVTITDYSDGFQYTNGLLSFFPHAEGYVNVTRCQSCEEKYQNLYDYVFNYTDHLGNIRMSWALDKAPNLLKIVEENHYYPFGLKHTHYNVDHKHFQLLTPEEGGPIPGDIPMTKMAQLIGGNSSTTASVTNNYKYNGKEYQDELGLNMYDYGARNYDPALGRWMNIDPLAEKSRRWSPFTYCADNPMRFIDPDGMRWIEGQDGKKVTYTVNSNGTLNWSKNATADTQRIGNAMAKSEEGLKQLNALKDSKVATSLKIEKTEMPKGKWGNSSTKFDSKGNATKSEITVYEANLKQFMTDVNVSGCTETSNLQTKEYIIAAQRNDLDSMIAADAGHEAVHSSDKTNLKERYENAKQNKNNDVEAEPERIETIILQQLNAIK